MAELKGPRPVETIQDRLAREITEEEKLWQEADLPHPSQSYSTDIFMLSCRLEALYHIIIDKGLASIKDIDILVMERVLENMRAMRQVAEPQFKEQRRQSLVVKEMPPELRG